MKFLTLFTLMLIALVGYTSAQRCDGRPNNPVCTGDRDEGRRCATRTMWYWNVRSRRCEEMRYLGCGGNNNRWCTRDACRERCRRGSES